MKNALEWLETTVVTNVDKIAYADHDQAVTFGELSKKAKSIGSFLASQSLSAAPVAVLCSRNCQTPAAFLGVAYSGRAYAPLDSKLPANRLEKILNQMQPSAILTDEATISDIEPFIADRKVYVVEQICDTVEDENLLNGIRRRMTPLDPLYIIYTSGSTGMPKGVITAHQSLMCYIESYCDVMGITEDDVLGNQSPLDYIAAIRDIYLPLKTGCSTVIIPKEYFMEPNALFNFMNERGVSSVGWSVSAFTIAVALGAFEEVGLSTLRKVCFSGSVMPAKCLRKWQENLPETKFVNQYGPTEATASCTYYVVDHVVSADEVLPIGMAYNNYRVFVLKEDNTLAMPGEEGEICVSGPCLALGYFRDPDRTAASFIQNPIHNDYQERIYRTGDIGIEREDGILEFHGRKDRQVKHMGHRVELDEIEVAANQIPGVDECCCIYQKEKEKLHLFYRGTADKKEILLELRKSLPGFMVPRGVKNLEALPKLANGKIDMNKLKESV